VEYSVARGTTSTTLTRACKSGISRWARDRHLVVIENDDRARAAVRNVCDQRLDVDCRVVEKPSVSRFISPAKGVDPGQLLLRFSDISEVRWLGAQMR
jgi:hypothetical protein